MKAFSSSVISKSFLVPDLSNFTSSLAQLSNCAVSADKSGKKFAPKAPVRRAAPTAPPRRPSAAQQTPAPTTQQFQPAATEIATAPTPEPPVSASEPSVPAEPPVADSPVTQKTADAKPNQGAIAAPIPTPKRKASVSTPIPRPASKPAASQPTPPPRKAPSTEPAPISAPAPSPSRHEPEIRTEESVLTDATPETARDETLVSPPPSQARRPSASAAEVRPTKRQKTTAATESIALSMEAQSAEAQPLTPPATQTETEETTNPETESQPAPASKAWKTTKPRNRKPVQNKTEDGTSTQRKRKPRVRQPREPTPEGAENIEIAPTAMKMSDLCKDLRTGKISKRETELRNMETAEQERKEKAQQEGEDTESTPIKQNGEAVSSAPPQDGNSEDKEQGGQAGPVMRIVNGEIVLDTASLQVDRHADAARDLGELEDVVENSLTRKVNQASYGKRSKTESWDEEMTGLFYRGLRMFGTDFMMISKMFPGRSRRQIKLKFNNEERKNPGLIKDTLLGPSESIDIATYSEMTNTVYDDPKSIQQELDEEKKRIEDQHAKEKAAQEELLRNPDGANEGNATDKNNGAPTKAKRNSKKQAKNVAGGTEEVVGSIDDFP